MTTFWWFLCKKKEFLNIYLQTFEKVFFLFLHVLGGNMTRMERLRYYMSRHGNPTKIFYKFISSIRHGMQPKFINMFSFLPCQYQNLFPLGLTLFL